MLNIFGEGIKTVLKKLKITKENSECNLHTAKLSIFITEKISYTNNIKILIFSLNHNF